MPVIGDIVRGIDLGQKDWHKRIWVACPDCGKERWVLLRNGQPQSKRCHPCGAKIGGSIKSAHYRGPDHWHWNGGRHVNKNGYITVAVAPDSPYADMRDKDGQVYEHRIVMAQQLGRCLYPWEVVHHINHDKQDNRPENLELLSKSAHAFKNNDVKALLERIHELEREVHRLKQQIGRT